MNYEDFILKSSFDFIRQLNQGLGKLRAGPNAQNPIFTDVSLQIILHIISCASALKDMLEGTQKESKTSVQTQLLSPFLNGLLSSVGKLLMDTLTFEPKFTETDSFAESYGLIMKHVFRLFPDMASKKHKTSGKLLIHHVVFKARPYLTEETVRLILGASPESSTAVDSTGALALHWATRNIEIPVEVIDQLVKANPKSISHVDGKGFLPLHWSVNVDSPNVEVVRKLLKIFPDGAQLPSRSGSLPLHYCVSRNKPSVAIIKALMSINPDAIRTRCDEGNLPLHRFVHRNPVDMDALKVLVRLHSEALLAENNNKQTPLHVSLDFLQPDSAAVAMLLRENPIACQIRDLNDYYPLHMALDCARPDYGLVEEILMAYPDAARQITKEGMMPLHLMISTNEKPSLSFARTLITAYPDAIRHQVHDIVPAIDGAMMVDPESWSGEWIEKEWTPVMRARERGFDELANLLSQSPATFSALKQKKTDQRMMSPRIDINNSTMAAASVANPPLRFTQPLRVLDPDPSEASMNIKFSLTAPSSFSPATDGFVATYTDSIQPVEMSDYRTEVSPRRNDPGPSTELFSSPTRDALIAQQQRSSSNAEDGGGDDIDDRKSNATKARLPPAGPIPNNLLQAAENNALRLSKSQYEFLKGSKTKKPSKLKDRDKASRGGYDGEDEARSDASKGSNELVLKPTSKAFVLPPLKNKGVVPVTEETETMSLQSFVSK